MNEDEAKRIIGILQAVLDKRPVQFKNRRGDWIDDPKALKWLEGAWDYIRVKPPTTETKT